MDWRDKASCLTVDPELFFPVGNTGPAVLPNTVCSMRSIRIRTLEFGVASAKTNGVRLSAAPLALAGLPKLKRLLLLLPQNFEPREMADKPRGWGQSFDSVAVSEGAGKLERVARWA